MTSRTYESLPAAAARTQMSIKTLRRRITEGVLPAYRCGRIVRVDPAEVDRMFNRSPQAVDTLMPQTQRHAARRAS